MKIGKVDDNSVINTMRFATRVRAALFLFILFISGCIILYFYPDISSVNIVLIGLFMLFIGYVLTATIFNNIFTSIFRCDNSTNNKGHIQPYLVKFLHFVVLSLPILIWVLTLLFPPWYGLSNLFLALLVIGGYLAVFVIILNIQFKGKTYSNKLQYLQFASLFNAVLLAILVLFVGICVLFFLNTYQVRQAEDALENRAALLLDLMENSVRVHLHNNRYMPDRLQEAFDALGNIDHVVGARLFTQHGDVITEAWPVESESPFNTLLYSRDDVLLRTREVYLDRPTHPFGMGLRGGGGRGPRGGTGLGQQAWEAFPAGPHQLQIILDKSIFYEEIKYIHLYTLSGLIVIVLLILSIISMGWSRYRRIELESSLLIANEQSTHLERLAQMGAGLAHETKNPLGLVRGLAQSIYDRTHPNDELKRFAQDIIDEADRIVGQLNRFLKLVRPESPRLENIHLNQFLLNLKSLIQQEALDKGILLEMNSGDITVEADPEQLRQLLLNLILNAFAACKPGDTVRVQCVSKADTADATLNISDTGCGIPADDLDKVRQPYFTRFTGGTGLGLALVDEIVRNHGWQMDIDSMEGNGTVVSIHGLKTVR